jgi:hypothetical protein
MLVDAGLTFREYARKDPLPKGIIQQAVIDFLENREDAMICGAMAVNAYVDERRMTEDVDIMSQRPPELAEQLRLHLDERFYIDVRVRSIREGIGYRLDQVAKPKNRHLVDVRPCELLPSVERIDGILVVTPPEVIAGKVISCVRRKGKPKSYTDRRDLAHMLLRFPELKVKNGDVQQRLMALEANGEALALWRELVADNILPEEDDDEFA